MCKELQKISLATIESGRLLVVRKKGTNASIHPGGKPEGAEHDVVALSRKVSAELGCSIANVRFEVVGHLRRVPRRIG
jgi:8-oxo-dGTP diphosphatase